MGRRDVAFGARPAPRPGDDPPMSAAGKSAPRLIDRFLNAVERVGSKLPDPALLFVFALFGIWIVSWLMAGVEFQVPQLGGGSAENATGALP